MEVRVRFAVVRMGVFAEGGVVCIQMFYSRRFAVTARPQRSRSAGQRATKSPRTGPSGALDKFKPKVDPSAACPLNGKKRVARSI